MPAAGLVTSGRSREPARSLISSQISKKKPEQKLRLSKQLGEGLYLPDQLAAQDARQAEDARTEQQDAAGLRSRSSATAYVHAGGKIGESALGIGIDVVHAEEIGVKELLVANRRANGVEAEGVALVRAATRVGSVRHNGEPVRSGTEMHVKAQIG